MKKILPLLIIVLFLSGCGVPKEYSGVSTKMGTVVTTRIYTSGEDITPKVDELLEKIETEELSRQISTSEIGSANANAGRTEAFQLSEPLLEELKLLQQLSEDSGGAFDCTIGPLSILWNMDELSTKDPATLSREVIPTKEEIEDALQRVGYEKLVLKENGIVLSEGMILDLGAAGKGIAGDEVAALLKKENVDAAVVSIGGSIVTYGTKPDKSPWQVAITDPFGEKEYAGILTLVGTHFVSTSGDYERFIEVDGVRYHHILDPHTGYPVTNGLKSVTIVCDSGILSDALSTACFVLGEEEGIKLAEKYDAEALFIKEDGSVIMTDGMQAIYKEY